MYLLCDIINITKSINNTNTCLVLTKLCEVDSTINVVFPYRWIILILPKKNALVVYWYVTNCHKSSWKHHTFIMCESGVWAQLAGPLFRVSWETSIKVLVRAKASSEGSTGEGWTLKLTWLSASLYFWQAVGLRAEVSNWLFRRVCRQSWFLDMWASPTWHPHHPSAPAEKGIERLC